MKVYGVGEGEYEQYGVVALYTSVDHADAVARACGGDVGEYELDPDLSEEQRSFLRPGERQYSVRVDDEGTQAWIVWKSYPAKCSPKQHAYITVVWAASEELAVKAARGERDAWLAAGSKHGPSDSYNDWCPVLSSQTPAPRDPRAAAPCAPDPLRRRMA